MEDDGWFMSYRLNMLPIEAGGTGVLDYDPELQENMEKALQLCGREDLVLCSVPMLFPGKHSLHLISNNHDLTDWWEACQKVSEEDK